MLVHYRKELVRLVQWYKPDGWEDWSRKCYMFSIIVCIWMSVAVMFRIMSLLMKSMRNKCWTRISYSICVRKKTWMEVKNCIFTLKTFWHPLQWTVCLFSISVNVGILCDMTVYLWMYIYLELYLNKTHATFIVIHPE